MANSNIRTIAYAASIGLSAAACALPALGEGESLSGSLVLAPGKSVYLVEPGNVGISVEVTAPADQPLNLDGIVAAGQISWPAIRAAHGRAKTEMRAEMAANGRLVIRSADAPAGISALNPLLRASSPAANAGNAVVLQDGVIEFSRGQVSIYSSSVTNETFARLQAGAGAIVHAPNALNSNLLGTVTTNQDLLNQVASRVPGAVASNLKAAPMAGNNLTAHMPGATVVSGGAVLTTQGSSPTIIATPGSVINWNAFIISGNADKYVGSNSSTAVLNRVTVVNSTNITGGLSSNGNVTLVNSNGAVTSKGGAINVTTSGSTVTIGGKVNAANFVVTTGGVGNRPLVTVGPR